MLESIMLMISDDAAFIETVGGAIRPIEGLRLSTLASIELAMGFNSWERVSLVLIHRRRVGPDPEVVHLLRSIAGARRPVTTIVVADHLDAEQGPALRRLGVADYLGRPLDPARLARLADDLVVRAQVSSEALEAGESPRRPGSIPAGTTPEETGFLEEDEPLMDQVRRVASQDATILLGGETGSGKTRLARRVHELSNRRAEPFVVVNCAALTANQVEAELFGDVRGSIEGTRNGSAGVLAKVGRGTLFLDDVDALPLSLQPRLLRVVEDRVLEAGGSSRLVPIRARLIAASNRDLLREVEAGQFRSDLYYRLNVIGLHLPPLRERRGAVVSLAAQFLAEASASGEVEVRSISGAALRVLEEYDWPGNVRELKNTIERAVALARGPEIQTDDLPEALIRRDLAANRRGIYRPSPAPASMASANSTLAEIKRDAELARITEALQKHSNNRLRAASELGISRMTLYKKLYKYGLMNPSQAARREGN